jgi:hypothetical protein
MSLFNRIFDVFSRRDGSVAKPVHTVPETTRNRVFFWCGEVFSNSRTSLGSGDYTTEFWDQIHRFLQYRHGRRQVSESRHRPNSRSQDAMLFLLTCSGAEFFDFVEYIFRVDCFFRVALPEHQLVAELNELLLQDHLPYSVTDFVMETVREVATNYLFAGREMTVTKTVAYPRVIMRESEVLHSGAIIPALELLARPHFKHANAEYLAAHRDYRNGDFGDSLTKCGSAFESVLKVVCHRKGWAFRETDTAQGLVKILLANTTLEPYFEQLLMIVATLRNRLSTSHGAGVEPRRVPRHLARYALNATASAVLLVADEVGES